MLDFSAIHMYKFAYMQLSNAFQTQMPLKPSKKTKTNEGVYAGGGGGGGSKAWD